MFSYFFIESTATTNWNWAAVAAEKNKYYFRLINSCLLWRWHHLYRFGSVVCSYVTSSSNKLQFFLFLVLVHFTSHSHFHHVLYYAVSVHDCWRHSTCYANSNRNYFFIFFIRFDFASQSIGGTSKNLFRLLNEHVQRSRGHCRWWMEQCSRWLQ